MFQNLKNFFKQANDIPNMAKLDQVALNVPADALYVTLSATVVVEPPSQLLSLNHQNFIPVTALADKEKTPMVVTYVVHNGTVLKLIRNQSEMFSTPLTNIDVLHRFMEGGFVLNLKDGRGIALSTPTPVQTDASMSFRTIQGMTDMTGGWLKELEPFGIRVVD